MTNEFELPPLPIPDDEVKTSIGRWDVYCATTVKCYAHACRAPLLARIAELEANIEQFQLAVSRALLSLPTGEGMRIAGIVDGVKMLRKSRDTLRADLEKCQAERAAKDAALAALRADAERLDSRTILHAYRGESGDMNTTRFVDIDLRAAIDAARAAQAAESAQPTQKGEESAQEL